MLHRTFEKPSWKGELILFSGNTDCYQPLEASLELMRACLEVCAEYRNPVRIITKGVLVLRDLDLLRRLHQEASVRVYFSIPFSDDAVARKIEPHAPSSRKRFEAMATLLRLSGPVEPVFMERMAAAFPDRITKITNRILDVRGGAISRAPSLNATVAQAPIGP